MEKENTTNKYIQWTEKINTICQATRFCGLCLNSDENLLELDKKFLISMGHLTHKQVLNNIVSYIFNDLSQEILCSSYLCNHCTEKSIQSYNFLYKSKHMSKIYSKFLNDLYNKTKNISTTLNHKRRDSNILIILEPYDERFLKFDPVNERSNLKIIEEFADKTIESESMLQEEYIIDEEYNLQSDEENNAIMEGNAQNNEVLFNDVCKGTNLLDNSCEQKEINQLTEFVSNSADNVLETEEVNYIKPINEVQDHPGIYTCSNCREVLTSYKERKKHKLCEKRIDFICQICYKSFIKQTSLDSHYKTHSKAQCKICQLLVPLEQLTEHMEINHADCIHSCKYCKYYTLNAKTLKIHKAKVHSGKCSFCFMKLNENEYKSHKCRFNCLDCIENICIHYKYLVSYRNQVKKKVSKIKCPDCDYVYRHRISLLGHVNREHLNHHPFTCAHCSQQFFSKTALKYHLNSYHKKYFKCEFCDQEFDTKLTLLNHKKDCETIKKNFKCNQCSSSFDRLDELENHVKFKHGNKKINCNLCERKFVSSIKLQLHKIKVHNGSQRKRSSITLNCPICKINCTTKKQLMEHIKIHGSNITYPCSECSKIFENIKKWHAHMQFHYKSVIQCECCNKVIRTTYYSKHRTYCKQGSIEKKILTCEFCGKLCDSETLLKLHVRNHIEKVPCEICGQLIKPYNMSAHITYVHNKLNKNKPRRNKKYFVKCDWCDQTKCNFGELENHVNRFHLKIKPYKCDYCKKTFYSKTRLKDHTVTHTTSKACYCSICKKRLENNVCLKIHMRIHTGYKPFTCEFCGERFRTSSMMNTHKITKHSEKSVSCPLCSSMFHLVREMRRHFKTVHWKQEGKPYDPRDVKELKPEFYSLFLDKRLPTIDGEHLYDTPAKNYKF